MESSGLPQAHRAVVRSCGVDECVGIAAEVAVRDGACAPPGAQSQLLHQLTQSTRAGLC